MKAVLVATALGLTAGPLLAGSLEEPTPTPVLEPAPIQAAAPSLWDGFYAGAQAGYGWFDADGDDDDVDGDDWLGGVHAGWQGVTNQFVYGVEADYNYSELDLDGAELNNLSHIKAKAGYDLGRTLIYATLGGAYADIDDLGEDWGLSAGAGVDYFVTDNVSVGGEAQYHWFDDFDGTDTDVEGTTLTAKVSYHF